MLLESRKRLSELFPCALYCCFYIYKTALYYLPCSVESLGAGR